MTTAAHLPQQCPNCHRKGPRSDRIVTADVTVVTAVMGLVLIALALAMAVILVAVAV